MSIIEKSTSFIHNLVNGPSRNIGILTFSLLLGIGIIKNVVFKKKAYQLKGKIALVTGASSGIGLAIATELAKEGCKVGLIARSVDKLKEICDNLNGKGLETFYLPCDLSNPDQVQQLPQQLKEKIGDQFIDIIVNNAGAGAWKFIEETSYQECQQMMALPYFAAFFMTRTFIPRMLNENRGLIVNVNSPVSYALWPGCIGYACSRYAMRGFSDALMAEVRGTNIRVMEVVAGETNSNYFESNGIDQTSFPVLSQYLPLISPEQVGKQTVKGIKNNQTRVVTPISLLWCIKTIGLIPQCILSALFKTPRSVDRVKQITSNK